MKKHGGTRKGAGRHRKQSEKADKRVTLNLTGGELSSVEWVSGNLGQSANKTIKEAARSSGYIMQNKPPWTMIWTPGMPFHIIDMLKMLLAQELEGPLSRDVNDWSHIGLSDRILPEEFLPLRIVNEDNIVEQNGDYYEKIESTHHAHAAMVVSGPPEYRVVNVWMDREVAYKVGEYILRCWDLIPLSPKLLASDYSSAFQEKKTLIRFNDLRVWLVDKIESCEDNFQIRLLCTPYRKRVLVSELETVRGKQVIIEHTYNPERDGAPNTRIEEGHYTVSTKGRLTSFDVLENNDKVLDSIKLQTDSGKQIIFRRIEVVSVLRA